MSLYARPQIAYFSPLPPTPSGIADHSAELLPYLAAYANITLFADDPEQVAAALKAQFPIRPYHTYPTAHWQYDLPLYHMGNSRHHDALYTLSLRYPGLVVLHELGLHHFIADRTIGEGDRVGYIRELAYAQHGPGPDYLSHLQPDDLYHLALNNRLIDISIGMIVHSRYVQERVLRVRPSIPTRLIPELMTPQTGQAHRRPEMHAPDEAVIFASLGQITAHKQIELALRAFHRVRRTNPLAYFLIVGEAPTSEAETLAALIAQLNLEPFVYQTGFIPTLPEFVNWLLLADVVLNLRHPTIGETSAIALRAMGAAKPLIVFDQGWYREIPNGAALKIPPLDEGALVKAMGRLGENADLRRQMGEAGQQYIRSQCAPEEVAAAYGNFIRSLLEKYV